MGRSFGGRGGPSQNASLALVRQVTAGKCDRHHSTSRVSLGALGVLWSKQRPHRVLQGPRMCHVMHISAPASLWGGRTSGRPKVGPKLAGDGLPWLEGRLVLVVDGLGALGLRHTGGAVQPAGGTAGGAPPAAGGAGWSTPGAGTGGASGARGRSRYTAGTRGCQLSWRSNF
jgi:hypothetical protein